MEKFLAALIIAAAIAVVKVLFFSSVGVARFIGFAATGKLNVLPRKDDGRDDPMRGVFVQGQGQLDSNALSAFEGKGCPLHGKPYEGMTALRVGKVRLPGVVAARYILPSCTDCAIEASRYRAFGWFRENVGQHPVWASAQIYPYLIGDRYFQVDRIFDRFEGKSGAADPMPVAPTSAIDQRVPAGLRRLSEKFNVLKCAPFDGVHDDMSARLQQINLYFPESLPILADDVLAHFGGNSGVVVLTTTALVFSISHLAWVSFRRIENDNLHAIELRPAGKRLTFQGQTLPNPYSSKQAMYFALGFRDGLREISSRPSLRAVLNGSGEALPPRPGVE